MQSVPTAREALRCIHTQNRWKNLELEEHTKWSLNIILWLLSFSRCVLAFASSNISIKSWRQNRLHREISIGNNLHEGLVWPGVSFLFKQNRHICRSCFTIAFRPIGYFCSIHNQTIFQIQTVWRNIWPLKYANLQKSFTSIFTSHSDHPYQFLMMLIPQCYESINLFWITLFGFESPKQRIVHLFLPNQSAWNKCCW